MSNSVKNIIESIEKVIIGKTHVVEQIMICILSEGHLLIEDIPGVGKTSLVSALAKSINATFRRIQFTSDVMPSDITGFSMYNQKTNEFEYRKGSIMSQIVLADEINRASPKTQASLLEAMEESQVTVDGTTYEMPKPFMVLATQNPIEYVGTFPLPEAQVDRFFMKISIGYPDPAEEVAILTEYQSDNPIKRLEPVSSGEEILELQQKVKNIHVDESLKQYIVSIINATRTDNDLILGASIRGSLALLRGAQAKALISGRDYCIPDDIINMIPHTLGHRIILRQEAKFNKITPESILSNIITRVRVPIA